MDYIQVSKSLNYAVDVQGNGNQTVLFIHGWGANRSYWSNQVDYLKNAYKVVTLDLAGHGESKGNKKTWSILDLAKDIEVIAQKLQLEDVILVGHSMGVRVATAVAYLLKNKVSGLIGIEGNWDLLKDYSSDEIQIIMEPFEEKFVETSHNYIETMLPDNIKQSELHKKILRDFDHCDQVALIGLLLDILKNSVELRQWLNSVNGYKHIINSDFWRRTDEAALNGHGVHLSLIKGACHYIMLEKVDECNQQLAKYIGNCK